MEEVKIRFTDGTEIEAEKNGSSYIVDVEPDFPDDLSEVEIETDQGTETVENAMIVKCAGTDARHWFAIIPKPVNLADEIAQLRADTDYIAAVQDIDL